MAHFISLHLITAGSVATIPSLHLTVIVLPLRYTYRKNDRDKRGNEPTVGQEKHDGPLVHRQP